MRATATLSILIALTLCAGCSNFEAIDGDGDGFALADGDCDDTDDTVHPEADDTWYDGVDQDCGGNDDNDADEDGYAAESTGGDDCDDDNASVNPGATDTWYDGVDQDCAGDDDFDADGDGWPGQEAGGADCDDDDASIYPGATEIWYDAVDQDCGQDNDFDADLDGYSSEKGGGDDCNDSDATIHPTAEEICGDGVDQDCVPDNCAGLDEAYSASGSVQRIDGAFTGGKFGFAVAQIGDRNGDGNTDILVGAPEDYLSGIETSGTAYVFESPLTAHIDTETATLAAYQETTDAQAGSAVMGVPGFKSADSALLLIGMPDYDSVFGMGTGGAVAVIDADMTGAGTFDELDADIIYGGGLETSDARFGFAMDAIGDGDGDGYNAFLVSAPFAEDEETNAELGAVYLFDGPAFASNFGYIYASTADTVYWGDDANSSPGVSVAGLGDISGDGISDWTIGAPFAESSSGTNSGAAYVFFGPHVDGDFSVSDADHTFVGMSESSLFGYPVAGGGDVNGDGYNDIGASAIWESTESLEFVGSANVFLSPIYASSTETNVLNATWRILGTEEYAAVGASLTFIDLDDDGFDDIVTAEPTWNEEAGAIWMFFGSPTGGQFGVEEGDVAFYGASPEDSFGRTLLDVGDQTGDGIDDLLIGASDADAEGASLGALYLFSGATGGD